MPTQYNWTSDAVVAQILDEPAWESCSDLAAKYNKSRSTISNIRTGRTRKGQTAVLTSDQKRNTERRQRNLIAELSAEYRVPRAKIKAACRPVIAE